MKPSHSRYHWLAAALVALLALLTLGEAGGGVDPAAAEMPRSAGR